MPVSKGNIFSGKIAAWLAVLFILLVPMAIGTPVTVAKTPCTHKNRIGENSVAALRLCPAERPQTPDLQKKNPGTGDFSGDPYGFRYVNLSQSPQAGSGAYLATGMMVGGGSLTAGSAALGAVYGSAVAAYGTVQGSTSAVNAYNNFQSGNLAGGAADTALAALDFGGAGFAATAPIEPAWTGYVGNSGNLVSASKVVEESLSGPFQIHINPATGVGPMAVDTSAFTSGSATLNGGIRNSRQFWNTRSSIYPGTLIQTNLSLIESGYSPVVDEQWIKKFPEHANYMGGMLVHHHLDYGPLAIPLPASLHSEQPGWGIWHPQHSGGD
jgi:hypothetical protein